MGENLSRILLKFPVVPFVPSRRARSSGRGRGRGLRRHDELGVVCIKTITWSVRTTRASPQIFAQDYQRRSIGAWLFGTRSVSRERVLDQALCRC
jgi:hypothetical protein